DQHSIDEMNNQGIQWPWPRQVYAPIVEYLSEASAIFIDILFTEPSSYGTEDDKIFSSAIIKSANVYMPIFLTNQDRNLSKRDMEFIKKFVLNTNVNKQTPVYKSAIIPIEDLRYGIKGLGNVTILPDEDGVYRQIPLLFKLNDMVIPNFVMPYFLNNMKLDIKQGELIFNNQMIPTVEGKLLLKYYKSSKPFQEISATNILLAYTDFVSGKKPAIKKDYFKGKYVFIGLTAAGLYDLKPTAVSPISTGIVIHSTLFDNLINHSYFRQINSVLIFFPMLLICLVTCYISIRYHSITVNLFYFISTFLFIICTLAILFKFGFYRDITSPILSLCLSSMIAITYSYATEGKERLFVKRTFSQYMDEKLVNYLLKNPDLIKAGGQRRYMTVFFADIAGFTTMAEKSSPENIAIILRRVLNAFTEIIIKNHGVIDKYIGDCVMAFWGAPENTDNDEYYGCLSALECLEALKIINEEFKKEGLQQISMRIGINSGYAIVGNLGSDRLFDYTVVGDTVNLASRLEGVNKFFGTHIIASENTIKPIRDSLVMRELGLIEVKGKNEPVRIYEIIGTIQDKIETEWLTSYHSALEYFYKMEFDKALSEFSILIKNHPDDKVIKLYKEKCEELLNKNGLTESALVFKMDSK
ncbi:MAG: adenylate/guanylate cyclase domain-containing protein, partial [Thermodesulfovibrionales bacterium]|nr:adenylate/guanylate cyclase domain-containing protein [Thermodesulfovibrionales bacterium]